MSNNGCMRSLGFQECLRCNYPRKRRSLRVVFCIVAQFFVLAATTAGPLFDTSTPASFFTNVASRLLSAQLGVNLNRIEVYPTNQYTPAVHRLLQVTANILDAQNTNFFPSVFRPTFAADSSGDIFIVGYQQVSGVTGQSDPQLAAPYEAAWLLNAASNTVPISDSNGPVNIYDVPWVVGAKQGLPNINQVSLVTAVQVTRKLEVIRDSLNVMTANYATNQMYIFGITNELGAVFWNSYSSNYPRPLTIFISNTLSTTLINGFYTWTQITSFAAITNMASWQGSHWLGIPLSSTPEQTSFLSFNWPSAFLSPMTYDPMAHTFTPTPRFLPLTQAPQLDQFSMVVKNDLQAYILDGTNIIDYVQFKSPAVSGNLNQAFADPDYPQPTNISYQWSTNTGFIAPVPWGVMNQLWVSENPNSAPSVGGQWSVAPTPMGSLSPLAEAAYFHGFFTPSFVYNGQVYVNQEQEMMAPYTPTRILYSTCLLQANDPIVHYLSSDMNGQSGALQIWTGRLPFLNGVWSHSDDPWLQPLPIPPLTPIGGRYQPWGRKGQMAAVPGTDTNFYNLAYKDPLVWSSDYWNFPTGQDWSLSWLGQVHRGTPWQTIYLKSTNILDNSSFPNGFQTWSAWTGDFQGSSNGEGFDSPNSAPTTDWQLASLLAAILNTNDLFAAFSVNSSDPAAWAIELDGDIALTNTVPVVFPGTPTQFSPIVISSNSTQASVIANAIVAARTNTDLFPKQVFQSIGDILSAPQLTVQSPYLNLNTASQISYAINDQAYEAIPSQLLPMLRMDSLGQIISSNGQTQIQFSGYDGHQYAVESSIDLLAWTNISTNSPTNGVFIVHMPFTA